MEPGYADEQGDQPKCAQPSAWDDGVAVLTPKPGKRSPRHDGKIILVL